VLIDYTFLPLIRWKQEVPDCLQSSLPSTHYFGNTMPPLTLPRREVTHAQKLAVTYTAHPMEPECAHILWWSIQMYAQPTELNSLLLSPLLVLLNGTSKNLYQQTPVKKKLWRSLGRHEPSSASNTWHAQTYSYALPNLARTFLSSVMSGKLKPNINPASHDRLIFHKSYSAKHDFPSGFNSLTIQFLKHLPYSVKLE